MAKRAMQSLSLFWKARDYLKSLAHQISYYSAAEGSTLARLPPTLRGSTRLICALSARVKESLRLVRVSYLPPCIGAGRGSETEWRQIPSTTTSSSCSNPLNHSGWFDQMLTSKPMPLDGSFGSVCTLFITRLITLLEGLSLTAYRTLLIRPWIAIGCDTVFCDTAW